MGDKMDSSEEEAAAASNSNPLIVSETIVVVESSGPKTFDEHNANHVNQMLWTFVNCDSIIIIMISVTRSDNLWDFGQLLKAFGNK